MVGTFGGALEARHIHASNGRLTADVTGEVELEEGVLVIRNSCSHAFNRTGASSGHYRARASSLCNALPALPNTASIH
jgi:hypothetical protein